MTLLHTLVGLAFLGCSLPSDTDVLFPAPEERVTDERAAQNQGPERGGASNDPGRLRVHHIQGSTHRSPLDALHVSGVRGVVTAVTDKGYFLQDECPWGDGDENSSEALFVFTRARTDVESGDLVSVSGMVQEYVKGGASSLNLPITEIINAETLVLERERALPTPVQIGALGKALPSLRVHTVSSDDVSYEVLFDPELHALDFWEALEGMRVEVTGARAVGPTTRYGDLVVVSDAEQHVAEEEALGLLVSETNVNPQRIVVDGSLIGGLPDLPVGTRLEGLLRGVVDYEHGHYRLLLTEPLPPYVEPPARKRSVFAPSPKRLTLATLNLENLWAQDRKRLAELASWIARELASPDIVAVQEMADDNGKLAGELSAAAGFGELCRAIAAAGGAGYGWLEMPPVSEDADGGAPFLNVRLGFLYRSDRVKPSLRGNAGPLHGVSVLVSIPSRPHS
jgi:hypothetical protein